MIGQENNATIGIAPELLTLDEAAQWLRVGKTTIYKLMNAGRLQFIQILGLRRISLAEIERFIGQHTVRKEVPRSVRPTRRVLRGTARG